MDTASPEHLRRLRMEFNKLVVQISRNLGDQNCFQWFKTLWAGIVPKQKLESATDISQFLVMLLEGDHVSLTNIEPLKAQFDTLELGHLTRLCSEYEDRAAVLRETVFLSGLSSDCVQDFQRLNIGDTSGDGLFISAHPPVSESGSCLLGTQPMNEPEESDENHFRPGSAQNTPTALTPSRSAQGVLGSDSRSPQGMLGNDSRSPQGMLGNDSRSPQGMLGKESCSPQGMLGKESCSPQGMLGKESCSPQGMLGKESCSPQGMLGNGSRSPQGMLGNGSRSPQGMLGKERCPLEQEGSSPVLDSPTGCSAKSSRSLQGPKLNPDVFVKDLPFLIWHQFTVALSVKRADGHDWRWLADKLGIPATYRDLWRQNCSNPAEKVLDSWKNKIGEATVGTLFNHMISMEREDLADIL
ncbi:uncharacterized protein LOC117404297 isoform X1 [Acipenser ruthenus]|uniref:uncharacterized protein LOC117404297 isoform X1 n=1 Tax=Acipenser ruthenus TaxID=7906 RepID=UPI002742665C|nr:uncharacterized protein LOC117404297 isoform X1 [Acipenser ruthenus]